MQAEDDYADRFEVPCLIALWAGGRGGWGLRAERATKCGFLKFGVCLNIADLQILIQRYRNPEYLLLGLTKSIFHQHLNEQLRQRSILGSAV